MTGKSRTFNRYRDIGATGTIDILIRPISLESLELFITPVVIKGARERHKQLMSSEASISNEILNKNVPKSRHIDAL